MDETWVPSKSASMLKPTLAALFKPFKDNAETSVFNWIDTAGLRQVQIKEFRDPVEILRQYYSDAQKKKIAA